MNLINKSYLHPVLRPGYDDVAGTFVFDLTEKVNVGAGNYIIDINATFENTTIQELIATEKAQICVFIYCKANFYRSAKVIKSFTERIEIPTEELSGLVELTIVVSAKTKLKYKNSSQHSDYLNQTFDITCGDILAVSETCTFYAEKEFDSLQKIESIVAMTIDKDLQRDDPLKISWDNDKIKVGIAEVVYQEYCTLTKHLMPQAINTMIFLPILILIISEWRNKKTDYEDENTQYRWFRAIRARAENLSLLNAIQADVDSPFVLAQKMLDAPITRSLDEIMKNRHNSEDGEVL